MGVCLPSCGQGRLWLSPIDKIDWFIHELTINYRVLMLGQFFSVIIRIKVDWRVNSCLFLSRGWPFKRSYLFRRIFLLSVRFSLRKPRI